MIQLIRIPKGDEILKQECERHYSQPGGFVGRSICFAVLFSGVRYGSIVAGSSTKYLPGRDEFFNVREHDDLAYIINNVFFHVEKVNGEYPVRNFTTQVIRAFRYRSRFEWQSKYGQKPIGFETLIEIPRSGECYRRDGWIQVGQTKGFTCKRTGGQGSDSWGGKRVWNKNLDELRPKLVLVRKYDG